MLSTAADLLSVAQAAPWLAVGLLSLIASAWVYRQSRRAQKATEERCQLSALRQGKRLGDMEKAVGLLDLRRRITEDELADEGIRLSIWPPDGPQPSRPRPNPPHNDDRDDRDDRDDDRTLYTSESPIRVPVPPVPGLPDRLARHRQ